jgi:hypothetical protein
LYRPIYGIDSNAPLDRATRPPKSRKRVLEIVIRDFAL